MALSIDAVSIATKGYWCDDGPDIVAMASQGHICVAVAVVVQRGGDSSKRGPYRLEPIYRGETPAQIRQRILQEDEEILVIIMAALEVINDY